MGLACARQGGCVHICRVDAQFCPWSEKRFEISRPVRREEHATRVLHASETGVRLFDVIVLANAAARSLSRRSEIAIKRSLSFAKIFGKTRAS
jgi:hypothetical protein